MFKKGTPSRLWTDGLSVLKKNISGGEALFFKNIPHKGGHLDANSNFFKALLNRCLRIQAGPSFEKMHLGQRVCFFKTRFVYRGMMLSSSFEKKRLGLTEATFW